MVRSRFGLHGDFSDFVILDIFSFRFARSASYPTVSCARVPETPQFRFRIVCSQVQSVTISCFRVLGCSFSMFGDVCRFSIFDDFCTWLRACRMICWHVSVIVFVVVVVLVVMVSGVGCPPVVVEIWGSHGL